MECLQRREELMAGAAPLTTHDSEAMVLDVEGHGTRSLWSVSCLLRISALLRITKGRVCCPKWILLWICWVFSY